MLPLILYIYICCRWTKRIARTAKLGSSKLPFVGAVCLKMLWRIVLLGLALIFVVAGSAAIQALPSQVEAASRRGTETGIAFAMIGILLSLLIAAFVAANTFHRRSGFYILHMGQQRGPFSTAQIRRMCLQNKIPENTTYWREGLSSFHPIAELEREPKPANGEEAGVGVARALDERHQRSAVKPPPAPDVPLPAASGSETERSVEKELRTLAALKTEGIISEDEFTAKKRVLLGI